MTRTPKVERCRYCGCTQDRACPGGCAWASKVRRVCDTKSCLLFWCRDLLEGIRIAAKIHAADQAHHAEHHAKERRWLKEQRQQILRAETRGAIEERARHRGMRRP